MGKIIAGLIIGILGAVIFYFTGMYTEKYSTLFNIISTVLVGWILGFIWEILVPSEKLNSQT